MANRSLPIATAGIVLTASITHAQWSYVGLHDGSGNSSVIYALGPGLQGGLDHYDQAAIWYGTADSVIRLYPDTSVVRAIGGDQQVGYTAWPQRAALWSGSPESFVDLHPPGWESSVVYGTDGINQGGAVREYDETVFAALWSGSPESFVNMNPAGANNSLIFAVHKGVQGGEASFGANVHAIIWYGSPDHWTDLHPAAATWSKVNALADASQAGRVWIGRDIHACAWFGTAESWVDLHPSGATDSEALGASGDYQVGWVDTDVRHAAVWTGTAQSWFDLHSVLSDRFTLNSTATSAYAMNGVTYVGGWARNDAGVSEAILWTYCPADLDSNGQLNLFDFLAFQTAFSNEDPAADLDHNSIFNLFDFLAFQTAYGNGC